MVTFEFLNLVLLSVYIMCTVRLGRVREGKKQSQNLHAKPYATTLAKKSIFFGPKQKEKVILGKNCTLILICDVLHISLK